MVIYISTVRFVILHLWFLAVYANSSYYLQADRQVDLSRLEKVTLTFWQEHNIFKQSVEQRPSTDRYVSYDGPPFANGLPHYGHLLTGYLKDTYARYQTMLGRRVDRRFGWDCHGLPAEMAAERSLNISGRVDIERFGVAKFNKRCKDEVSKYMSAWEDYVTRQGRWVDFQNGPKTMTRKYMESVMWAFKRLYLMGLVYESERVVPYSWACQSPLSNFETKLDNSYRVKLSKAVTVMFELLEKPARMDNLQPPLKMLVWTTTPWTLPSNLALAVGPNVTYTVVWMQPSYGQRKPHYLYMFAKQYFPVFEKICDSKKLYFEKLNMDFTHKELVGIAYKPMFPYFQNVKNAFKVLLGEHVSSSEGTGIVHIAPGFGEADYDLCVKHDIPAVCPIDSGGKFTSEVWDFNGSHVFDTSSDIVKHLKTNKAWFHTERFSHNYPHCWRTDTPLIYRTMPSWFVAVTKIKNRMIDLNKKVNWIPEHVRDGMFGNWIEAAEDWSVSRNRFWGTPIPVWKSDNPEFPRVDVYGSVEELERDFSRKVFDLHRPIVDDLTRPNPDDPSGKSIMRRVSDVFDCWFDSGSMPFAQYHYPFENKEMFEETHPADFVTEYIAQTRGWFYTTFVLSAALFNKEPFKNCICHGVVLDARGRKLSKRLDNYEDPAIAFVDYGSDALRFLMLSRPVVVGDNLLLDKKVKAAEETMRVVLKPIWNSYRFFALYANADGIKGNIVTDVDTYTSTIDKYILLKCFVAVSNIKSYLDRYNTQDAAKVINDFFGVLNNWYIRRSRERFWKSEHGRDKRDAYNALYTVFNYILRSSAPLLPFIAEAIWRNLGFPEPSVHLTTFPVIETIDNSSIISRMDFTRGICNAIMSLRKMKKVRVRQPLKGMRIYHESASSFLCDEYKQIIKDETNVKEVFLVKDFEDLAAKRLQLNFSVIGKRIPNKVKLIVDLLKKQKWSNRANNQILIEGESESCLIHPGEYEIKLAPHSDCTSLIDNGRGVVQLDLSLDEDLVLEGYARDVIRSIQETRKQADLHVSDRIRVTINTNNDQITEAINKWRDYIKEQTLAVCLDVDGSVSGDLFSRTFDDITVALRIYHDI